MWYFEQDMQICGNFLQKVMVLWVKTRHGRGAAPRAAPSKNDKIRRNAAPRRAFWTARRRGAVRRGGFLDGAVRRAAPRQKNIIKRRPAPRRAACAARRRGAAAMPDVDP